MKWILALVCFAAFVVATRDTLDPEGFYTEIPKGSEDLQPLLPFLDQTYTLFGEGSQMLAFLSEDGRTVLKIFKKTHTRHFKLSRALRFRTKDLQQSRAKWTRKFQDTCRRYRMALTSLKEETGLLGLHFVKTKDPLIVTLKAKRTYQVDLAELPFILQKRATLAPDYAKAYPGEARQALIELFIKRIEKGFSDPRQSLSVNYGFIDHQAVQLDVGKIEPFEGDREKELQRITEKIDLWLANL